MSILHKKVVQEITPQLIVKYVLPKREVAKIILAVAVTEMLLHAPVRNAWVNKTIDFIDEKLGTSDDQSS